MSQVAAAILAAGRGARVAGRQPKPLLRLREKPLAVWALDAVMATELRPVVLVVGHRGRAVAQVAPQGVEVVRAHRWRGGIAHSLHAALVALEPWSQVGAVCVGLADQPLVGADAYRRLEAAHRGGASLAVATYGGVRGNPVLLARALWPEARKLRGDVGAKALMDRHDVTEVDCTGTGDPADVDTLEALTDLERRFDADP